MSLMNCVKRACGCTNHGKDCEHINVPFVMADLTPSSLKNSGRVDLGGSEQQYTTHYTRAQLRPDINPDMPRKCQRDTRDHLRARHISLEERNFTTCERILTRAGIRHKTSQIASELPPSQALHFLPSQAQGLRLFDVRGKHQMITRRVKHDITGRRPLTWKLKWSTWGYSHALIPTAQLAA
ncbi:hypothetical protein AC579_4607 [Pseudocercospora musae]|uniref:Uncharacterized protein n=1 Tax=Pseudocercospora musae TaxID=113226 RepID=A0A139GUL3_9PEZI|nr:hypothetical protein AC579_4607 [Pseudocercospora musae]